MKCHTALNTYNMYYQSLIAIRVQLFINCAFMNSWHKLTFNDLWLWHVTSNRTYTYRVKQCIYDPSFVAILSLHYKYTSKTKMDTKSLMGMVTHTLTKNHAANRSSWHMTLTLFSPGYFGGWVAQGGGGGGLLQPPFRSRPWIARSPRKFA